MDGQEVKDLLDKVVLCSYQGRQPQLLSGGQAARVALARALYFKRPLLVLDDPFASVDEDTA